MMTIATFNFRMTVVFQKPATEGKEPADLKLPGDRKIEQGFRKVEKQLAGR